MLRNKLRHNKKKAIKGGLWPIIHTLMDHPLPLFIYLFVGLEMAGEGGIVKPDVPHILRAPLCPSGN